MKVLWFLVRLYCVFLLIFLHASFGSTKAQGREGPYVGPIRGSPSRPIGKPGSHP
ncbi:hypothetical protein I3842_15G130400 [Carya illinoinensis]|uniref:Uncharacterized protein n=1 Tax=Carya illinoinensis TaxID=32201 RepID=A0A922AE37_CARIL|nr:hypothetical protein I3842_15G130400 [Carya illinoinensis]